MHQGLDTIPDCPLILAFTDLSFEQLQEKRLSHCFYKKLFIFSGLWLVKKYPICLERPEYGDFETFFIRYKQAYPQIVWTMNGAFRSGDIQSDVKI
ncbi:hypothetical protein GCM10010082_06340 [Kushneria pakistanensis]|uniref:Uncharacterized protein n=1 Tax=Kushneria pakistanensis TaxID=1508770 RepID=A0ABQ3FC51_9GAMM|nr:hypothetical protein GCM10010082_06340 [Kushneria pakistanensis]